LVRVFIPAGGRGSRFRPYTDVIPKPMLPIGSRNYPILHVIVELLRRQGFNEFVFGVNYMWEYIRNYFGDGSRFGVHIDYVVDDDIYTGTGGALLKAYVENLLDDETIIWYGDIIAFVDVKKVLDDMEGKGSDAVIVFSPRYRVPVGVGRVEDGVVVDVREKPYIDLMASIGILALKTSILGEARGELGTSFDIMGDLVPWMIRRGRRVIPHVYKGFWYDMGSWERYVKFDHRIIDCIMDEQEVEKNSYCAEILRENE
jgi:mannose-1-phosphate guanylyltransferase